MRFDRTDLICNSSHTLRATCFFVQPVFSFNLFVRATQKKLINQKKIAEGDFLLLVSCNPAVLTNPAEGGNRRPKAGAVSPKAEMLGGSGGA